MSWLRKEDHEAEGNLVDRINDWHLLPRKSFEVMDTERKIPLTAKPEVKEFASQFLKNLGIDPTIDDEVTGWERFWAQEKAAAMTVIAQGGNYLSYLAGRSLHYELMAHEIASSFEGNGHNGIKDKKIAEFGAGSHLGLMFLAKQNAQVTGLDRSIMAGEFGKYLADHYKVAGRVKIVRGDYFKTQFDDGEFDFVYSSGVAEHEDSNNIKELLKEMNRVTKREGYILIAVPNEESPFYKGFKRKQVETEKKYPDIIGIPVEHKRYRHDLKKLMELFRLVVVKEDGLQIAPSSPIKHGDISAEDTSLFDSYLPHHKPSGIEDIVGIWTRLELNAGQVIRSRYGWSRYAVGQKKA